jgi:MFS transporter, Spinster family, sphingosine-1-phosphate transporter
MLAASALLVARGSRPADLCAVTDPTPDTPARAGRAARTAWVALVVLTLVNLVNYMDRYVVPGVGESLQHSELHLTDSQFGALTSAFFLVYMCAAPVLGAYGHRRWRLRLVAGGIAVWSVATALAGLAHSYPALLSARASVGIGEAAYSAIAPALLADAFPARLRGRVFSVFFCATPVGSALGSVFGGVVDQHYGWRAAFLLAGVPGLLLAVLVLTLTDPARGTAGPGAASSAGSSSDTTAGPSGLRVYRLLLNRPYVRTVLGYAAYTFALGGIVVWMPAFLVRVHHVTLAAADKQLGAAVVVTGFIGTFLGGWLGDALVKRTREGYLWLSGASMLLATPLAYVALTARDPTVYWASLIAAEILLFISTGPVNSALVGQVPRVARAAAMAGAIFTIHLLGDVPSPVILGRISERSSLADAVLIIPVAIAISGLIWVYAAWRGDRDVTTTGFRA